MNGRMQCLVIQIGLVAAASAGLTFEKTLAEFHPKPDQQRVHADFAFRNDGQKAVRIAKTDAACSCMEVGTLGGKLDYAPGETGVIRAVFNLTGLQGTSERVVAVWLDGDPAAAPTARLTVRAHIPEVIRIHPKTLTWDLDGAADARTISIEMAPGRDIRVLRAKSTSPNIALEVKTIQAGRLYEVVATPQRTDTPGITAIRIDTDCEIEAYKSQSAFGVIRKPIP